MFESIAQSITGFLQLNNNPLGLAILGLSALVEYIFPPFPGDSVTLFGAFLVVQHDWSLPWVFVVVLTGSGIGAMANFFFGVWIGKRYHAGGIFKKDQSRRRMDRVIQVLRRHGEKVVAINRFLPAVRAFIFVGAGIAGLRPGRVLAFAMVSAAVWNTIILAVGYALGANWARIKSIFQTYGIVAWGALGSLIAVFMLRWFLRRRRGDENSF